ncbi:MAG: DUF1667 domain-containing protein [Promethearchaeota archaeon]
MQTTTSKVKKEKNLTCIICPSGCSINVRELENGELIVEGNQCKRGLEYAKSEFKEPKRILATTVKINNAKIPLLPVRTNVPAPKDRLNDILNFLATVEVNAPIKCGDIIAKNVIGLNVDVIATRTLLAEPAKNA